MCQNIALILIASYLLRVLNTIQHEVGRTVSYGVGMDGESLLVCLCYQLYHLVVIVEAFYTVIARLIVIILEQPSSVCLGHTVQQYLQTDDIVILVTVFSTNGGHIGHFRLRVFCIVSNNHVGIGTQLQLAFLLQFIVGLSLWETKVITGKSGGSKST